MSRNSAEQSVLLPDAFSKPVQATFDTAHATSDAGAIFLHRIDRRLNLVDGVASVIAEPRDAARVVHSNEVMLRQRVMSLALGYGDCNDAARVGGDPVLKMCAGRSPTDSSRLASQPTLSRFENRISAKEAISMQSALANCVLEACHRRYGRNVKRIAIDLDPTDDPTYGGQQLSFFNAFYDNWCYLPLMGFLSFDKNPEQHLFLAMLRPGNSAASLCVAEILSGIVSLLRARFRKATILVRLDGAYATREILELLEGLGVKYVVNMPKNAVLNRAAASLMTEARIVSKEKNATAAVAQAKLYLAELCKFVAAAESILNEVRSQPTLFSAYSDVVIAQSKIVAAFQKQKLLLEIRLQELELEWDNLPC